jgi:arylsulfatase A-like enzyme/Flp pilus assembly protein TadD
MRRGLLLLAAAALLTSACSKGPRTFRRAPVVLISIDTLRADHLPAYGYKEVRTPAIDAFRKDAVLFENAYSHVPLTLPSHSTLFTGLLPPQDGVRDNVGYTLSPTHETMAELLKKNGYATGAAISAVVLDRSTGINSGFDAYDDDIEVKVEGASLAQVQRSGFETEEIAEKWIGQNDSKPFFYFLHLYEPHSPYTPIEPFKSIYKDRPYDGEIATADKIVGEFLEFLKAQRVYDRAIVILLSDHGEGLGQHGEDEHGTLLYRETLHVPLLVKLPGSRRGGDAQAAPVGLTDVYPTVAKLLDVHPPAGLAGRPLPDIASDPRSFPVRDIYSETLYPRYHFGWSDLAALTDARYEYIHAPRPELYDFRADPGELRDLAPGLPPAFRRLRTALLGMDRPRQAPGASDPEQLKKLAALGYLGAASPPESATNLPDPKDRIGELGELKEAFRLYHEKDYDQAITGLERLLEKNPLMADAWGALANSYHKLGRTEDAIRALQQQDRVQPGSPITLASLANEYFDLGDLKQARLFAQRSIAVNGPPQAHEVMASIYLDEKKYAEAESEARLAMANHRGRKRPFLILAQVAKARGDLAGALKQLDEIANTEDEEGESELSNVEYLRGDILARMGRSAEAEKAFQTEIRHFPNNAAAWTGLAFLYASEGEMGRARETLNEMVRTSSTPRTYRAAAHAFGVFGDRETAQRLSRMAAAGTQSPTPRR